MKPTFIKRIDGDILEESFTVRLFRQPTFVEECHRHAALELVYITRSRGYLYVGTQVRHVKAGDLILLGSKTPHLWMSEPSHYSDPQKIAEAIVVHFEPDFLGNALQGRAELDKINMLIKRATKGMMFGGVSKQIVPAQLQDLLVMRKGLDRLILLMKLLNRLAEEENHQYLTVPDNQRQSSIVENRLNITDDFVINHFRDSMTIQDVAARVKMSPTAFGRFFKEKRNTSFGNFVHDIRIGYALQLLASQAFESPIELAKLSGYQNMSTFNIQFKRVTGTTPMRYIKEQH